MFIGIAAASSDTEVRCCWYMFLCQEATEARCFDSTALLLREAIRWRGISVYYAPCFGNAIRRQDVFGYMLFRVAIQW